MFFRDHAKDLASELITDVEINSGAQLSHLMKLGTTRAGSLAMPSQARKWPRNYAVRKA